MKHIGFRSFVYTGITVLVWIAGVMAALLAASHKFEIDQISDKYKIMVPALNWMQDVSWWLSPSLFAVMGVGTFINKQTGKPWVWELIHGLLDQFCKAAFENSRSDGEPMYLHRVTLFRRRSKWHLKSLLEFSFVDRLFPVERSGHVGRTKTSFAIKENPVEFEGMAGLTWVENMVVTKSNLPKLTTIKQREAIKQYAKETFTSEGWIVDRIKKNKPLARSFCGIPVSRRGKPWGVIVIDSQSSGPLENISETMFGFLGHTFSNLIERV